GLKGSFSLAARYLLRAKSYSIVGVPRGLISSDELVETFIEAEKCELVVPKSAEATPYWRFERAKTLSSPAYGILRLSGGTATHLGGNLHETGRLITTFLQPVDGKPFHRHDLFRFSTSRFFPKVLEIDEPVVSLTAGWQDAFYHWIYEVLPRFAILEKAGIAGGLKIYIDQGKRFQRESLNMLGIDTKQIIDASQFQGVRAKELIIPSIPIAPVQWVCEFLRDRLGRDLPQKAPLRLYISRADAEKRRVRNELELDPILEKHGFQKVEMSRLPFREQAACFASAEIVVGPHGAAFAHLAFCRPGTPILEIFDPAYTHLCYWQIANGATLRYHFLFGEGERYPDGFDPHIDPDIEVDPKKFEEAILRALADR
ncbi:MAG: glycosyltransferase family 61 protein, partial [Chlamydiales bacterium]